MILTNPAKKSLQGNLEFCKMVDHERQIELDVRGMLASWPSVGYDSDVPDVAAFYAKADGQTQNPNSFFYGKKLTDIFIFSMLLGKKEGVTEDYVNKGKGRKSTIDGLRFADNPNYIWMMLSIAIDEISEKEPERDLTEIVNPENAREVIDICEKYANHGIHELIEINSKEGFLGYEKLFETLLEKSEQETEV